MQSIINCQSCGLEISSEATYCPHCKSKIQKYESAKAPCWSCNTVLPVDKYLHITVVKTEDQTFFNKSTFYYHSPCPNCKTPRPLRYLDKSQRKKGFDIIISSALAVICFYFATRNYVFSAPTDWFLCILPIWIAFALSCLYTIGGVFNLIVKK